MSACTSSSTCRGTPHGSVRRTLAEVPPLAAARIAARLADEVIVTSDNPRTENPYAILHEILAGMADSATPFAVLESRREAIAYALDHARTGDVVVLAGKGHETYQVVGAETLPLDERQVVREHLSQ